MVEFIIPDPIPDFIFDMLPEQHEAVIKLFHSGELLTYTLSQDRTKLWAIFMADSESEIIHIIDKLPMSQYFQYDYKEVMFHDSIQFFPAVSLN